jgi:transcriptional regulator with XRE-family HTH domain
MNKIENEEKKTNRINDVLEKVIYRRKRLGLSQTDIANKLEITLSGYFKMETGKTKLDIRRLLELSEILKVELEYFLKE